MSPSIAQFNPNIEWEMLTPTVTGKPGSTVEVRIQAKIAPGSHLYTTMKYPYDVVSPTSLEVTVGEHNLLLGGPIESPDPIIDYDQHFEYETEYWEGTVTLIVPVKIAKGAKGSLQGWVNLYYMTCDDRSCQIPTDEKLHFIVQCKK